MFHLLLSKCLLQAIDKSVHKHILYFFLILIGFDGANAQTGNSERQKTRTTDSIHTRFSLGVAGGTSFNDFSSGQPHTNGNTGIAAGLSLNYAFLKNFSLQTELNFIQQGGRYLLFIDDTRYGLPETFETKNVRNSSFKLNSVEIPLLIAYTYRKKSNLFPTIYTGASYAYSFNVVEHYQKTGNLLPGEDVIATATGSRTINRLFKQSRVNFIAGVSLQVPLTSRVSLLIDTRYMLGLNPVRENYSYMDKVGFGSDIRVNSFISRLGLVIPIK